MTIVIHIEVPDATPPDVVSRAEERARKEAVLVLQQAGGLTIREAAAELGLTYEGYLGLLSQRGLPASNADRNEGTLRALRGAPLTARRNPSR